MFHIKPGVLDPRYAVHYQDQREYKDMMRCLPKWPIFCQDHVQNIAIVEVIMYLEPFIDELLSEDHKDDVDLGMHFNN